MKDLHKVVGGLGMLLIPIILIGNIWFDQLPTTKLIETDLVIIGLCYYIDYIS